jgi:hypothetical protein
MEKLEPIDVNRDTRSVHKYKNKLKSDKYLGTNEVIRTRVTHSLNMSLTGLQERCRRESWRVDEHIVSGLIAAFCF